MRDTRSTWRRRVLVGIGELVVSLALVALFFMIFVGIYSVSFPNATDLGELIRMSGTARQGDLDFEMSGLPEDSSFSARLSEVHRMVKEKPADGIVWNNASSGIPLGEHHAVQSFARSGATISFDDQSRLRLGENSLVVIRETRRAARSGRRTATVVVLGGEVSGQMSPSADQPLTVEIVGAGSSLRVESSSAQTTGFKVTTSSDDSSTFAVYDGAAVVELAGRTIELGPNQFVTIDAQGTFRDALPQPLPPSPAALSPADGSSLTFRGATPRVEFTWEQPGADSSRFILARDAGFQDVVHEVVTPQASFRHGALAAGSYFWQVSRLDGSAESPPSPLRRFEILRDREAPALQVRFPDAPIETALLDLVGKTEPGARVFVGDLQVDSNADGSFAQQIRLQPGINVVVVEAIDPVGNTSYASSVVHARFAVPESTQ